MPSVDIKYPRTDFPEDLECHPLLVVDFAKVKAGDEAEIDQLYNACTNLGFFYLKNHGIDDLTEPMFEMGKSTFSLPAEELLPFEQGKHREGLSRDLKITTILPLRRSRRKRNLLITATDFLLFPCRRRRNVGWIQVCRKYQRGCARKR
jgi:isopenicillin N synthase-like dioxygenase